MKNEIWKDIKGYNGMYQISNHGRVRSFKVNSQPKVLQPFKVKCPTLSNPNAYRLCICLNKWVRIGNKMMYTKKDVKIHRLVAEAFLKDFKKSLMVRKKNRNADENDYKNLRLKKSIGIEIIKVNRRGKRLATFSSIKEAKNHCKKASRTGIRLCTAGIQKSSGGFSWKCKR